MLGLTGLLFVPLPARVVVPAMVEPEGAKRVYVTVPGTLQEFVAPGEAVRTGQMLARLENQEVRREVVELSGLREVQQVRLASLHGHRVMDPLVDQQIPVAEESLRDLERRLEERRLDEARLTLAAPREGTVLPAPSRHELAAEGELPSWSGVLLDDRNRGSYLQTGELLCLVGDPRQYQALLVVDQSDVALVAPNQRVRVQLDLVPGRILEGRIRELSEINLQTAPRELLTSGLLPTRENSRGEPQPLRSSYLARVSLETRNVPLLLGAVGTRQDPHCSPIARRAHPSLSAPHDSVRMVTLLQGIAKHNSRCSLREQNGSFAERKTTLSVRSANRTSLSRSERRLWYREAQRHDDGGFHHGRSEEHGNSADRAGLEIARAAVA